jgi:hypothetical protein
MISFISENNLNGRCDSSIKSENDLLSISLEVIFSYVEDNMFRQKELLEYDIIDIILPLFINLSSSESNSKMQIGRFIRKLCRFFYENIFIYKNLIIRWKLFDYIKSNFLSLSDDIKKIINEYNPKLIKINDEIKMLNECKNEFGDYHYDIHFLKREIILLTNAVFILIIKLILKLLNLFYGDLLHSFNISLQL